MASEQGLAVDEEGFRRLMSEQRQRAKQDSIEKKTGNADISAFAALLDRSGPVVFTGYNEITGEATVTGLLVNGALAAAAGAGTEAEVVLDRTPFYAEGGGQLADAGIIRVSGATGGSGAEFEVRDVQSPVPGLVVHRGVVTAGEVTVGAPAFAEIDIERRRAISRSHTATHLVHRAFKLRHRVLGVDPGVDEHQAFAGGDRPRVPVGHPRPGQWQAQPPQSRQDALAAAEFSVSRSHFPDLRPRV